MKKGENIGGYKILQDFEVKGGMSMISFASKGGEEYFIKKFLKPKFPIDGAPGNPATLENKRKRCSDFENHHKKLNKAIDTKCAYGGNLVYAVDFFREGTFYYKVTEKIDIASLTTEDISKLPLDNILIILKTVSHSLKILHSLNIVHGDLKPDNILIKQTETGGYTSKLIDFDNSYFSQKPPLDADDVVGTPEYYSPELGNYVKNGETEGDRKKMTPKSDIFALGIIFYEYLAGEKPSFPDEYNYPWEAVKNGERPSIKNCRTEKLLELIRSMLQKNKQRRPNIDDVFSILKSPEIDSKPITPEKSKSTLRISDNLKSALSKSKKPKKSSGLKINNLNAD